MKDYTIPEPRSAEDFLVVREADIAAPPEAVFGVIEDLKLFEELEANVKEVVFTSATRRGPGTRSRWTLEDPSSGARWSVDEEIVHYEKPRQLAYIGTSPDGKDYAGSHTLSPASGGGTHLHFAERFYFKGECADFERVVDGLMANVKRVAEARAASRPSGRRG